MHLGQLAETESALTVTDQRFAVDVEPRPADVLTFESRPPHAGADTLNDQATFQLGDGADDHDHGAAQWTTGVEVLAEADEFNVQVVEFVQHLQKVPSTAGQPIAGPDQHHLEAAMAGVGQHPIQTRAACPGPRDAVGVAFDNFIAALLGDAFQIVRLGSWILVQGRDPGF